MASAADYRWHRAHHRRGWSGPFWTGDAFYGFEAERFARTIRDFVREAIEAANEAVRDSGCDDTSWESGWCDEQAEWSNDREGYQPGRWRDIPR